MCPKNCLKRPKNALKSPKIAWKLPERGLKVAWKGPQIAWKLPKITWRGPILLHKKGWAFAHLRFWNGVWGRGCDEAEISEEKRLFIEWGQGIQWMKALVRNSTGKAIQWRGLGHSVNRRTLKIEFFCAHLLLKFWLLGFLSQKNPRQSPEPP